MKKLRDGIALLKKLEDELQARKELMSIWLYRVFTDICLQELRKELNQCDKGNTDAVREKLIGCIDRGWPFVTELKPLVKKAAMFFPAVPKSSAKPEGRNSSKGQKPAKRQRKS